LQFLGVAGRDDVGAAVEFVETYEVGAFEHAFDEGGDIWARYGVTTQPAFAFISADGEVNVQVGRQGEDSLIEEIEALLSGA